MLDVGTPAEIMERRGLRVAEVECRERAVLDSLRADARVEEVAPFGSRLRVTTRREHDPAALVRAAMAAAGLRGDDPLAHPAAGAARPAHPLGLYLRCDLPQAGQGGRSRHAVV